MSSTLSEGVRVPDIGSTSWGADVNFNWGLLNTALANISGNVKVDVANTWTAPQTFTETISGSIDGIAARAVGDEDGNNIKAALATKAADADVVHLAGAETITGDKTFTGATATHNITPEADNTYSLGGAESIWNSVYANTYYANTSFGVRYASTTASAQSAISGYIYRAFGVKSSDGKYFSRIMSRIAAAYSRTEFETYLYDSNSDELASIKIQHAAEYNSSTGTAFLYVRPTVSGAVNLGIASNKWKTLNGINPGALSLPNQNGTDRQTLDTTGWVLDGSVANTFTPSFSGWLNIRIPDTAGNYVLIQSGGAGTIIVSNQGTGVLPSSVTRPLGTLIPVTAGVSGSVRVKAESITGFFYPCLGNV